MRRTARRQIRALDAATCARGFARAPSQAERHAACPPLHGKAACRPGTRWQCQPFTTVCAAQPAPALSRENKGGRRRPGLFPKELRQQAGGQLAKTHLVDPDGCRPRLDLVLPQLLHHREAGAGHVLQGGRQPGPSSQLRPKQPASANQCTGRTCFCREWRSRQGRKREGAGTPAGELQWYAGERHCSWIEGLDEPHDGALVAGSSGGSPVAGAPSPRG